MNYEFVITDKMQDLIDTAISQADKEQTYPIIITDFVRQHYSQSQVEAIMNNYLDDMTDTKHYTEFKALQDCRKQCKAYAKQLLNLV